MPTAKGRAIDIPKRGKDNLGNERIVAGTVWGLTFAVAAALAQGTGWFGFGGTTDVGQILVAAVVAGAIAFLAGYVLPWGRNVPPDDAVPRPAVEERVEP